MSSPAVRGAVIARNSLLNLAGHGLPLIVAFVALPVMIRGLGSDRFGILAMVWMLLTYLSDLGFGSTTTRYAAEALGAGRTQDVGGIIWTTGGLQVMVGIIEGLALAALAPWLTGSVLKIPPGLAVEARACVLLLAASLPFIGLARSFRGLVEGAQRFDLALLVHLPTVAGTYILAALAASYHWSLLAVFALIIASRLITVPAYLWVARRALPGVSFSRGSYQGRRRELTTFTTWVAVSSIVSPLLVYIDRFMVGALLSMAAVTFYAAPYELVGRLVLVPAGILGALYPAFSHLSGLRDRDQAENLAARSINLLIVLLSPLVILVLAGARDGLTLWLGPDYAERSALALQILVVGVLVNAAAHVPFGLLQSAGRPDVPARFHLIELPLQLLAAWFLVSRFGIPGAALAWTGRMIFDATLLFVAAERMHMLRPRSLRAANLPATLTVLAVSAVAAALGVTMVGSIAGRTLLTTALVAGTVLTLWFWAVPSDERGRIKTFLRFRAR